MGSVIRAKEYRKHQIVKNEKNSNNICLLKSISKFHSLNDSNKIWSIEKKFLYLMRKLIIKV